jgi:hypothetical protein
MTKPDLVRIKLRNGGSGGLKLSNAYLGNFARTTQADDLLERYN